MKMSLRGKIELFGHEGICLSKYLDSVGVWTIGVGSTSSEIPNLALWPAEKTITMQEVVAYFENGIDKYEDAINKNLSVVIPQEQFDALVSWCYNVGVGWVAKSTVMRLINAGNASKAQLYNAMMMYNKPAEIIGRRAKEAKLLTGDGYQNGGEALLFPVNNKMRPVYSKGKNIDVAKLLGTTNDNIDAVHIVAEQTDKSSLIIEILKFIFRWVRY